MAKPKSKQSKKKSKRIPGYRLHKPSGQARVRIRGRAFYLGEFGTPESHEKYRRIIAEYLAQGSVQGDTTGGLLCSELAVRFMAHAREHYRKPDGRETKTADRFKRSLQVLTDLYGSLPVKEFGPAKLKAVRAAMIDLGWCRNTVNARVSLIRQAFGWGVSEEIVPPGIAHALSEIPPLEAGRSKAPETEAVLPVPEADIWLAQAKMPPSIATMIELQLVTGMRTGEVCLIRPKDIARDWPAQGIWAYRPMDHKNAHHGHERVILIGPRGQRILEHFLSARQPEEFVFQPKDSLPWEPRKRKRNTIRDRYYSDSYAKAVHRACEAAGVTPWSPGRLRHNAATFLAKEFSPEVARIALGHSTLGTTRHYMVDSLEKAAEALKKAG